MFRTILARTALHTLEQFPVAAWSPHINKQSHWQKIAIFSLGIFAGYSWKNHTSTHRHNVVFAVGHNDDSYMQHIIEEIINHQIWHLVGHVVGLGSFASGILGSLFSFQSLGEKDTVYIPRQLPAPIMTKCINPENNRQEPCLIINGKKLVGQDLLSFLAAIKCAHIIENSEKRTGR